jgi:hypothetical protein
VSKRKKLKAAVLTISQPMIVHDRQATELPAGAFCVPTLVRDPYDPQNECVVTISLRDDPLGLMFYHYKTIDTAQYWAGRRFQQLYEATQIGNLRMTLKEAVDGGGITVEMVTDYGVRCRKQLMEIATIVGRDIYNLLCDILGLGMYLLQAAAARGIRTDWGTRKLGKDFREGLEKIASEFNYV